MADELQKLQDAATRLETDVANLKQSAEQRQTVVLGVIADLKAQIGNGLGTIDPAAVQSAVDRLNAVADNAEALKSEIENEANS